MKWSGSVNFASFCRSLIARCDIPRSRLLARISGSWDCQTVAPVGGGCQILVVDARRNDATYGTISKRFLTSLSRGLVAHMEWVEDKPGDHDLVEYETRLNYILPRRADLVICTCDYAKFDAAVVADVSGKGISAAIMASLLQAMIHEDLLS